MYKHPKNTVLWTGISRRWSSTFDPLQTKLKARTIPLIYDQLSPLTSHRLDVSLAEFLPDASRQRYPRHPSWSSFLPPSHHFLYCEPTLSKSKLLPDGTNPEHFPGAPFHRRMWAGGSVRYCLAEPFRLDNRPVVCAETIRDVNIRGSSGSEKIFVDIERRLAYLTDSELSALDDTSSSETSIEDDIRRRLWRDDADDPGPCSVLERRSIVFMRKSTPNELAETARLATMTAADGPQPRILKTRYPADLFDHTTVPDKNLLFRYSALTFNAHAIHLEVHYCQQLEAHRDLLVHGTLGLSLLILTLCQTLRKSGLSPRVRLVEYRNLATIYCHEPVRLCGHRSKPDTYEIWAETPQGGIATRATVRVES